MTLSKSNDSGLPIWINRSLEALWLSIIVLVPLGFLDRDYALSEAVISYVEVPKVGLLRTLAGLMAILWLIEWGVQGLKTEVSQPGNESFSSGNQLYFVKFMFFFGQ